MGLVQMVHHQEEEEEEEDEEEDEEEEDEEDEEGEEAEAAHCTWPARCRGWWRNWRVQAALLLGHLRSTVTMGWGSSESPRGSSSTPSTIDWSTTKYLRVREEGDGKGWG